MSQFLQKKNVILLLSTFMIEHLVLSSAGPKGLIQLGMLQQLIELSLLDVSTIKSIHGSSAGSILGVLLGLSIPIQDIIDYFTLRPIYKLFKLKVDVKNFFIHKGFVSSSIFEDLLLPFFHAHNVPESITMKEMYDRTGIDMHIFTTAVTEMNSVDLNHITFPDLPVIQAISMSSAIPFLFTPIIYQEEHYIDGGVVKHCPIPHAEPDTIMVILIDNKTPVDLNSSLQFIQHIMMKSLDIINSNIDIPEGKYVFRYNSSSSGLQPLLWNNVLTDKTYREQLIEYGKQCIKEKCDNTC